MSAFIAPFLQFLLAAILSPLALGLINKTKAVFAGRKGQPLLQAYHDIAKLLRKGAVYSTTTGWMFRAGPIVGLSCALLALAMLPWAGGSALFSFQGDLILLAYLFGLGRFMTILAALDTGSAFEGMGASREAWFSALAEPALLLGLASLAAVKGSISLQDLLCGASAAQTVLPSLLLASAAAFVVFLAENARIPVDDPNTHLELTMIHEVMVLDHGGVDFAFVSYGSSVKLWVFGGIIVGLLMPKSGAWVQDLGLALAGMAGVCIATGTVESIMARLRLVRVPQLLVAATAMSALALVLTIVR